MERTGDVDRWERSRGRLGCRSARAVYAHRGASGYRPEHTVAAYALAIDQGAHVIEPDLVPTRDGVLVVRHENEISGTTDVAGRPALAGRRTTRIVDGRAVTGWFTEDLTLEELRTLRVRERLPDLRPGNASHDGRHGVPTFQDVVDLARTSSARTGRTIAIAPELKHAGHFRSRGLDVERELVRVLRRNDLDHPDAPVIVQSFEDDVLRRLAGASRVRKVQLLDRKGRPPDRPGGGSAPSYADMGRPQGLRRIAGYAEAVAPHVDLVLPRDRDGRSTIPTTFVDDAHRAGLPVIAWTLRREDAFLPLACRAGRDPGAPGALQGFVERLLDLGVDGVFSDNPDIAVAAVRAFERGAGPGPTVGDAR
ncbi:MAG: glycerophosphodiester phosphodiesterase [Solirubrobacteraceae bacterium]|nr:glycerophosphodiester phosphodiesterase [Solirubrobacteraceae bacterium]